MRTNVRRKAGRMADESRLVATKESSIRVWLTKKKARVSLLPLKRADRKRDTDLITDRSPLV